MQPNTTPTNDPQAELIARLKEANNILVTVSANPSVDQLAACIGLTILLNKLKKHATAVFSGNVPSTIGFLKPEDTLEKTTDSLRDFIISLDKAKADKLRYKVEENIVKIFITPYKTSITEHDLDFSQGDFNVDVVLALGVHEQQDLDQAITAHGRILHDAVVVSVNTVAGSELGAINWTVPEASSLSELATDIADGLAKDLIDSQIATALLTGIVAETERFSNEKTSPETMRLSSELMAAGANQQLVASELQRPADPSNPVANQVPNDSTPAEPDDGTLDIVHPGDGNNDGDNANTQPNDAAAPAEPQKGNPDDKPAEAEGTTDGSVPFLPPSKLESPHRILEPPAMTGQLTANSVPEDSVPDFGGLPQHEPDLPILNRDLPITAASDDKPATDVGTIISPEIPAEPVVPVVPELELPKPLIDSPSDGGDSNDAIFTPAPEQPASLSVDTFQPLSSEPADTPPAPVVPPIEGTLAELEQAIHSPHVQGSADAAETVDDARSAVLDAINSVPAADQPQPAKEDVGAAGYLKVQDLPGMPPVAPESVPEEPAAQTVALPPLPPALTVMMPTPSASAAPFTPPAAQPVPYVPEPTPGTTPADTPLTMPLPPAMTMTQPTPNPAPLPPPSANPAGPANPLAPPPVPPPMTDLPPFVNPSNPS